VVGRITQRSTGRQKQARFLSVGKLLVKECYHFKRKSFFAFAACELSRYGASMMHRTGLQMKIYKSW